MASDNTDVAATHLAYEEGGSTCALDRFVVRQSVPHWNVADYRRLHLNKLEARRFGARLSDWQKSSIFNRLELRRDTGIAVWNRRGRVLGSSVLVLWIHRAALICRSLGTLTR